MPILIVAAVVMILGTSIRDLREVATSEDGFDIEWQSSFDMQVGDCFDIEVTLVERPQGADLVSYLHKQECANPHDREISAIWPYPAELNAPYPGKDTILWWSSGACERAFEQYTGIAFGDDPDLTTAEFLPTEATWEQGGREMYCLLASDPLGDSGPFQKLVGSRRATDN